MICLTTKALPTLRRFASRNLGRLMAADNDCFQGLDATRYDAMLDALEEAA